MLALDEMHAMVLAAGLGMRMRPLTERCPKPLIEVGGRRLIDYAFDTLRESGLRHAVVNTHYLAEQIEVYTKSVSGLKVHISHETERLETGGGIVNALPKLGDGPFFALNSDTICLSAPGKPILSLMHDAWEEQAMDALLLLMPIEAARGYYGQGDFVPDATGERFRRRQEGEVAPYVFTGAQLLHPRLFDRSPEGAFSMNVPYNRCLDANGWFGRIGFLIHEGDWLHVGDAAGLEAANAYFQARRTG